MWELFISYRSLGFSESKFSKSLLTNLLNSIGIWFNTPPISPINN